MSLRIEGAGAVGGHGLGGDVDVGPQAALAGEFFRHQHRRGGAAGWRAGHQARHHAGPDHRRVEHVLGGHFLAEQRQRIVHGVAAGLGADLGEGVERGAVFFHVGQAGAAEVAQRQRDLRLADQFVGDGVERIERARAVGEHRAERARAHLLEAEHQHAVGGAAGDRLARQEQRGRAGRAVVVDVDDRDAGHADLVQRLLAAGGVAVDVAGVGLLDVVVADAGVVQRLARGQGAHLVVRRAGARLGERDHAHAGDEYFAAHCALLEECGDRYRLIIGQSYYSV